MTPCLGMAGSTVMLMPWMKALETAVELEFCGFEIFGEFPQCVCKEDSAEQRRSAKELVARSGVRLAVHSPFTSLNIAALNPGVRAESVRQGMDAVDLCADLGGETVIVHNGEYVYSDRARAKAPQAFTLQWEYNVSSLRQIADQANKRGVTLCLENIGFEPEHMDRNVDDMLRIRDQVGLDLAFCLDIGHARLNHELEEAINKMGPYIRHIHFTDNFGEKDDHVIIGEGNFDYIPYLDFFRRFNGIITLEVVSIGVDPSPAVKSRDHVTKLLGLCL